MSFETSELNELHWLMEMLHNIDVGLVVLDKDYKIQIFNGFMENHSGYFPREVKGKVLFELFDEISEDWFKRKAESVFLLKNKAYTIWEQRPYLFQFESYRPVTGSSDFMYQNTTFIPLLSSTGEVSHLCLLVYDVTDNAVNKMSLENVNEELAILSQTDSLTGLFNRMHWENCLQSEYKRWLRTKSVNSLIMLDIDHFKNINNNYGHLVGDEVIRHLSKLISEQARETDVAGRYDGKQFTIFLPDASLENALIFAERLRKTVEDSIIKYNDIELHYTISTGIAELEKSVVSAENLIECANSALFKAKENDRNKICLHPKNS